MNLPPLRRGLQLWSVLDRPLVVLQWRAVNGQTDLTSDQRCLVSSLCLSLTFSKTHILYCWLIWIERKWKILKINHITYGPRGSKVIQYFSCKHFVEKTPAERCSLLRSKGYCIHGKGTGKFFLIRKAPHFVFPPVCN